MTQLGRIYLLTFSNGKLYIGQTRKTLAQRMAAHSLSARQSIPKLMVHKAWRKHGQPRVDVLLECAIEALNSNERALIKLFHTMAPIGYNATPGGETSPMLIPEIAAKVALLAKTPERIARNRAVHLGRKRTAETRQNISKALIGKMAGIPKSELHRQRLREAHLKLPAPPRGIRKNTEAAKEKMRIAALARWARERESNAKT